MTRPMAQDFERFLSAVQSQHRSSTDYHRCTNEELVSYLALMESHARRVVLVFIDAPEREPGAAYEQAAGIVYRLRADDLLKLHEHGADREVLGFLVNLRCDIDLIHTELRRRLRLSPVGKALLRVRRTGATAEAIPPLLKVLKADQLTSYRPEKEGDDDLQAKVLTEAMDLSQQAAETATAGRSFPERLSLNPPADIARRLPEGRWDWPRLHAWELAETWKWYQPMLSGKAEGIAEQVRQRLREHWRKWKAQKRTGVEVSEDEADHAVHTEPEAKVEVRVEAERVYAAAVERWGEQGRRFVEALAADKSVAEAAKAAGVSRPTAHKYLRELKRLKIDEL